MMIALILFFLFLDIALFLGKHEYEKEQKSNNNVDG